MNSKNTAPRKQPSFQFYEKIYLQLIILIAAVLILYIPILNFQFTQYDDSFFKDLSESWLKNSGHWSDAFTKSVFAADSGQNDSYYRPLLLLTFYLDEVTGGGSLKAYYFTNIFIHAINIILLLFLLRKLKLDQRIAFWFTLFFAVHPALMQAVAWIPGRNDSLMTLFALISFILLIGHIRKNNLLLLLLHLLFFELALLTKEIAVLLPVLYLFIWYIFQPEKTERIKFPWLPFGSWILFLGAFMIVRGEVIQNSNEPSIPDFLQNLPALLIYSGKMLFPFNLSTFPILKDSSLLFGIVTALLTFIAIWLTKEKNKKLIWLAVAWWILFLLPAILRTSYEYESVFLEHRIYFPLIGFLLLWSQTDVAKKPTSSVFFLINSAIAILLVVIAHTHRKDYSDEEHYWSSAVQHSPEASFARRALGNYYYFANQLSDAQQQYEAALQLNPNLPEVRNNLGRIAMNRGNLPLAENYLKQETLLYPNSYMAYYNLGLVKMNQNNFDSAEFYLRKSIAINPDFVDSKNDLSVILAKEGKYEDAIKSSIELLEANPDYIPAQKNVKLILSVWNDPEKVNYYQELLRKKGIMY